MKSLLSTLLVIVFFLFLSCTNSTESEKKRIGLESTDDVENKTLILPVDGATSNCPKIIKYFTPDSGETEYLYQINSEKQLLKYDLKSKSVVARIQLATSGTEGLGHELHRANFYVHTEDSIFIGVPIKNHIVLINNEGKILNKYNMLPEGFAPIQLNTLPGASIFTHKKKLYSSVIYHKVLDFPGVWNGKELFSYNIENEDFVQEAANFTSPFFDKGYVGMAVTNYSYTYNSEKGLCIRSLPGDPNIYISNLDKGTFSSKNAESKYFKEGTEFVLNEKMKSMEYEDLIKIADAFYFKKSNEYGYITYDPYRKKYYRFAIHGTGDEPKPDTPTAGIRLGKKFSIIVLDVNFNKIKETEIFKPESYNYRLYFISKEGLWLSRNFPHKSDIDEDKMVFELFEL